MAAYPEPRTREGRQRNPQAYVNMAGGAVSTALIIGVCIWGYQLVMRDANGIPVVRAMEGPMRVAPSEPGGIISDHSGLAVNAVAALGGAAAPEDSEVLLLAPPDVGLTTEDISVQPTAEAGEVMPDGVTTASTEETIPEAAPVIAPIDPTVAATAVAAPEVPAAPAAPMTADDIIAMADQLAAGQEPLSGEAPASAPVATAINGVSSDFIADIIPSDVPGVAKSPRPPARPATVAASAATAQVTEASPAAVEAALAAAAMTSTAAGAPATVTQADAIPVGTNLAQLGAYDSPEIAAKEWDRFVGRFGEYMVGKERIIQQAERGGRTFYRLRVKNFEDLSDARRFCAALSAENTDCVPVVVR